MGDFIEIKDLSKVYYEQSSTRPSDHDVLALNNINLNIKQGEALGLVGESGSGKTTLGKILLGFENPSKGQVLYKGQSLANIYQSKKNQEAMQIIFQNSGSALNPFMTALDLVAEPLTVSRPKKEALAEASRLLKQVSLDEDSFKKRQGAFSGGQKQRIAIARALSTNPEFIVCDEPVSALDVSIQAQIINLLMDLQDDYQLTYLFISHDLSIVRSIAHRIAVLYKGNLVELAQTEDLFAKPHHPYTQKLLASIPNLALKTKKEKEFDLSQVPESDYLQGNWQKISDGHFALV